MGGPPFGDRYRWQRDLTDALTQIRAEYPGAPSRTKTIYFVRHAQSNSNVAKEKMSSSRIRGAVQLFSVGFDSGLSEAGQDQLFEVRPTAQRIGRGLDAVLFSPLQRAAQTALKLFGDEVGAGGGGGFRPPQGKFWRSIRGLKEQRFKEHAQETLAGSRSILRERVLGFIKFVSLLPWESFALVGHSRFFRTMLDFMGADVRLRNANIWRVSATLQQGFGLHCISKALVAQPASIATSDFETEGEVNELRSDKSFNSEVEAEETHDFRVTTVYV